MHFSFKKTQFLQEKFQIFKTEKKLENAKIRNQSKTQLVEINIPTTKSR